MKILHVIPSLDLATGGPPRIALRLAAQASAQGHDVTIVAYDAPPAARTAAEAERRSVIGDLPVSLRLLPAPGRSERLLARGAKTLLGQIITQFDIVHCHDVWTAISRSAMTLAVKHSVPFVLLPNGMFDPWSLSQKRFKKRLFLALGYRRILQKVLFFHAGNEDEKLGIRDAGFTRPIEIIPNGINSDEFDPLPARGNFRSTLPSLGDHPFVLFMSRLHYKKGLDYLAAAFTTLAAEHPQLHLVVCGPEDGAGDEFQQSIAAAGLSARVHVTGAIFTRHRFDAMVDCACFCLPSRQEGFSIAILEALACARPVVISKQCHFPEVGLSGAGEVIDLNTPALIAALNRVLADPIQAENMGRIGREMVLQRFTWPVVSQRLIDAYARHRSQK